MAATLEAAAPGEPWVLVGHSLGGKVAMVTTLTHPELVRSLVVVDIAPKDYGDLDRFVHYIEAMRALPLDELTGRADAEARFAAVEPDPGVRGFLLQNLRRHGTTWSWQANLELLAQDAARGTDSQIADFPELGVPAYDGPVVWLVGGDSSYVKDADTAQMRALFPKARPVVVNGVGHWVHSEAPEVVTETLRRVLAPPPAPTDTAAYSGDEHTSARPRGAGARHLRHRGRRLRRQRRAVLRARGAGPGRVARPAAGGAGARHRLRARGGDVAAGPGGAPDRVGRRGRPQPGDGRAHPNPPGRTRASPRAPRSWMPRTPTCLAASYDVVASSLVLFFLPDPAAALARWVRLLAPGGRIGLTTFGEEHPVWTALERALPALAAAGHARPQGRRSRRALLQRRRHGGAAA